MNSQPIPIEDGIKKVLARNYYRGLDKSGWTEAEEKADIKEITDLIQTHTRLARIDELLKLTGGDWGGDDFGMRFPNLKANSGGLYIADRLEQLKSKEGEQL